MKNVYSILYNKCILKSLIINEEYMVKSSSHKCIVCSVQTFSSVIGKNSFDLKECYFFPQTEVQK